jgi:hypothetical protein
MSIILNTSDAIGPTTVLQFEVYTARTRSSQHSSVLVCDSSDSSLYIALLINECACCNACRRQLQNGS